MKYLLFFLACLWLLPVLQAQNCAVYVNVSPQSNSGPWTLNTFAVQDTTAPPPHPQIVGYAWSNGATTNGIQVNTVGQYCITATFDNGCTTSKCTQVTIKPNTGCWLNLYSQIIPGTTNRLVRAVAGPSSAGPFTYLWNNGQTTDEITVSAPGNYCATVTNAQGNCTADTCIGVWWKNCSLSITQDAQKNVNATATGAAPFAYLWSNGATTSSLNNPPNGNYCLTMTDATGCSDVACINIFWKTCKVSIAQDAQKNINATATGAAPFTYLWSNGATTSSLNNPPNGIYCLTMTDATGCSDVACITVNNPTPSCFATLRHSNSTGIVSSGLITSPTNLGPYTYTWSDPTLPNTAQVTPGFDWTTLCVTITNSDGCSSSSCITNAYKDKCIWNINCERINSVSYIITPFGRFGDNATYVWSTGETNKSINIENAGTYTVTVTGTCTDVLSTSFQWTNDLMVSMLSTTISKETDIKTWVIAYSPVQGGTLTALQEKFLGPGSGNVCYIEDLPDGEYLIKSACMPGSSDYQNRMPTYSYSNLWWHEAKPITIPSLINNGGIKGKRLIGINFIEGQNPGGPGFVGGLVSEGANFTHNGTENTNPIYPATVILYDQDGKIVAGVSTAPDGTFEIQNLPYGTYKLMVDAPGLPQHTEWITIGPTQPQLNLNIAIKKSLGTSLLAADLAFELWPNPVFDGQINIDAPAAGLLNVKNIQGQIMYSQKIASGISRFSMNESTPGIYFIELQTAEGRGTKKIVVGQKP